MSLFLATHYQLARASLKRNRIRSFLTCLGVAIGVASIILIFSLMGSIKQLISNQTLKNPNLIIIRPHASQTSSNLIQEVTSVEHFQKSNLSLSDLKTIKKHSSVQFVAPIALSNYSLKAKQTVNSASVLGTSSDLAKITDLPLNSGSFISNSKSTGNLKPAIIGKTLALNLFNSSRPIGKTFTLKKHKFIIIGVLEQQNSSLNFSNIDFDQTVITNIDNLFKIDPQTQIQQISLTLYPNSDITAIADQLKSSLSRTKSDSNFSLSFGNQLSHPANRFFSLASKILSVVASISLIVGGIGVMNIMLVSVAERTHEVGIRKAVGATNLHIFIQFLLESLILCCIGGIFGLILGYILTFATSIITGLPPFVNLPILLSSFYIPVIIGSIFGLYPALKAAHKNPIDSLKIYH